MVRVVLPAQVVDVRRGDQRTAELAGVADDAFVRLRLLRDLVRLDLEVEVLGPVDLGEVVHVGASVPGRPSTRRRQKRDWGTR